MRGIAIAVLCAALAGCSSAPSPSMSGSSGTSASSTTAAANPTGGGPSGHGPGDELCRIDGGDGSAFYLAVTSPKLHDLSQCDGGTPIQGWVEQLFGMGIQTRCHYNAISEPSVHAIVTVYSSGRDVDKGAALGRCKAHKASYP
jgi:hypothetical protein